MVYADLCRLCGLSTKADGVLKRGPETSGVEELVTKEENVDRFCPNEQATSNKGIATSSKDASSSFWHYY